MTVREPARRLATAAWRTLAVQPGVVGSPRKSAMQVLRTQLAAVLLAAAPLYTHAQQPLPPPPQIPYGVPIAVELAKKIAATAIAAARRINGVMAVAIVDTGGYLVYFEKMDNTQTGSIELAIEKARSAALFRRPTKVFQDAVAAGGDGLRVLRLTGTIPNAGGIPIIAKGSLIGAIGISGGSVEQDDHIASTAAASSE